MAKSRVTTWTEKVTMDGSEAVALDDGTNAKLLSKNIIKRVASSNSTQPNFMACDDWNSIDSSVGAACISAPARSGFPNIIGDNSAVPAGTDFSPWPGPDSGTSIQYSAGHAQVASIVSGYDNVNNQIAGIVNGFHCFLGRSTDGHSAILAGGYNYNKGGRCVIVGGSVNVIGLDATYSTIGGGQTNEIKANSDHSFIGTGQDNEIDGDNCFIGTANTGVIGNLAAYCTILSANNGTIAAATNYGVIISGSSISLSGSYGFIGTGVSNSVASGSEYCFIGTGNANAISGGADRSAIITGGSNTISGGRSIVGAGNSNTVSGAISGVLAGDSNTISGNYSFVMGNTNRIQAQYSQAFGTSHNIQGEYCFAQGQQNLVQEDGSAAIGHYLPNYFNGVFAQGAKQANLTRDCASLQWSCGGRTTDASATKLECFSGRHVFMPNNSSMTGVCYLQAYDEATGNTASWELKFSIKRYQNTLTREYHDGTTALHDDITVTGVEFEAATWGGIRPSVQGAAATNIVWSARVEATLIIGPLSDAFTANTSTEEITTTNSYRFLPNETVQLTTTGTLPAGLSTGTTYYVKDPDQGGGVIYYGGENFQLATTPDGTAINITDTGTGTHTVTRV